MATKSILKNIEITNNTLGTQLANALQNAKVAVSKKVEISRKCTELKGKDINDFFDN